MKVLLRNSAMAFVVGAVGLGLGACSSSDDDKAENMTGGPLEVPTRTSLAVAIHHPEKVLGTLSGNPYATEQLLGDLGEDSVRKDDLPLEDDSHALEIDGGAVRQGRGGETAMNDPSLAPSADNEFTRGDAPATIAGFTGSTHDRFIESLDEHHRVVVYTSKTASGDAATDYLDFGYWFLDYADPEANHIGYFTHTFARGSVPSGDVSAVTGTASYDGAATGLYVKTAGSTAIASGQFTATAELTADFGASTISGTVSDFRDADGGAIDDAWTVSLDSADIDPATGRTAMRGTTTGMGAWRAAFYGSTGANSDEMPGAVAGTFDAHLSNGHVGGALAAHKR